MNCDDSNRKNCRACEGNNCNSINLLEDSVGDPGYFQELPLNCYNCVGEECAEGALGLVRKCELDKYQTCTVAFNSTGSVIARGCSDSIEIYCMNEGNRCYECKSNGCNLARAESEYIDCLACDAQDSDECANNVAAITRTRKCRETCMTALYARTKDAEPVYELLRSCLDDMDLDDREACEAGNHSKCIACKGANCNTADLGERKSCYVCEGDSCQVPEIQSCRAVMDHDQCSVEYNERGELTKLGCKSDYDPEEVKQRVIAKQMWLCDADNCNHIESVPDAQRCTLCHSLTDVNCAVNPENVSSDTNCNKAPYSECYSRVHAGNL